MPRARSSMEVVEIKLAAPSPDVTKENMKPKVKESTENMKPKVKESTKNTKVCTNNKRLNHFCINLL